MTDEQTAAKIHDNCDHGDTEAAHDNADKILCELLTSLGYVKTVEAWNSVDKWYA